ncbi:Ig-like domain-containing protein [Ruegeria profundi]|uniref:Ig-like domain-containing protein n=1 Tax=Ruegeria profundi TaxID=1685378 RepID=UPI001CD74ABF|nr:Ig-like domain-containing protein [Ruegeria profundi]MCA0928188.1 Ig-like domain-containing protein [Ruegeria profundi]
MTKAPETQITPNDVQPDFERKQKIRQWIDGKMRRWAGRSIAGGLGSTILALPALAQATIEELYAFQFAETIPGVRSVKLLDNGDVVLKLADGRKMVVAAENVQVLDSGAIMIAEGAVSEIAQLSLAEAGGAAAAAAGGVSAATVALGGLGLAGAAAAAAGGGGGGGGGDDTTVTAPTYPVLNLAGAQGSTLSSASTSLVAPTDTDTVEITIGTITKTVTPDSDGMWTISLSPSEAASLPQGVQSVTVRNLDSEGMELATEMFTFDVDTIPPTLTITGFSDGPVVNASEQSTDLAVTGTTDAEDGQNVTVTINGQTYSATVSGGAWSVTVPAADLASLSDGATVAVTADVEDQAGNSAMQANGSFDTDFTAPTISLDPVAGGSIELIDVGSDLILTGSTNAVDGQPVTVVFDGQSYSAMASGGAWSVTIPTADLGGLSTGVPAAISVSVSDAAGNISVPVSASVPVDLTGPSVAISPLSVGEVLNAVEIGSDLTISGTTDKVGDGQQVTVTLNGQTYTGSVTSGSWSVIVPAADLGALADGGSFSITADVSDADGLVAPQASVPLSKDATAPTLSIDSFSGGAFLNATEQGTDLTITGSTTAENRQTVTISMNGSTYTATVSGGAWSVTVPAADLAALSDGATVSVTADVSDAAGNPAVQATGDFDTDFTAPSISITSVPDGAVMNAAQQGTDLIVTGLSDAPDGTVITFEITRPDGTVDVSGTATVSSGGWAYTASAADLSALQDGVAYEVAASVSDAAGNSAVGTASFSTDFSAPTVTIDPLPVGSELDLVEQASDLVITGTTSAEDGQTVTVTLNGQSYTGTASGGVWSTTVPSADLTTLSNGTSYPISANVSDLAGNPAILAATAFTTDFRPILTINAVGTNNAVSLTDAQASGVMVSGTSLGLSAGQIVDVTLNGNSVGPATVGADGTWSLAVPDTEFTNINAGDDLNFTANAAVSGGPDPLPASDQNTAHESAAYVIAQTGMSGNTLTFAIYADADRDISTGLDFSVDLGFDPSVVTFNTGSDTGNASFDLFTSNPICGSMISFGAAATTFTDLSQPLVTFDMTVVDPSQPIVLSITTPEGGPSVFQIGTNGDDTLVATAVDNVIRGQDGDDMIDLSEVGRDLVVFEADPAANGVDTITGFTIGNASDVTDGLMFSGLNAEDLRGNGTGFESLADGDAVGADTGFVGLTTVLSDLSENTIETAVENFAGIQAGDELFVMATDGSDSALFKVDYTTADSASVETNAHFSGLDDLNGLSADNILHTDPTGATS